MNKEFIPYEQALELKELGFDELCYAVVTESNDYHGCDLGDLDDMELDNSVRKYNGEPCLPAPLYQQAFRWLKWKTGTYGYHFIYQTSGGLLGVQNIEEYYKGNKQAHGHFGPYEDAELDCIKQLIEIAKKDNR
jgi:hypothetical protein